MDKRIPFSIILPVYHGDNAEYLDKALESLDQQTVKASEIVLVQDGPVGPELESVISSWQERMPSLKIHALARNSGLSSALNSGIENASNEWLARMDADDLCRRDRFEKQLDYIVENPGLSLLGSWIEEFEDSPRDIRHLRKLPEKHGDIAAYARYRCPFNHMTVMYKKSAVLDCGGYRDYGAVGDDYVLWVDFIRKGYKVANIPEPLVKARTGKDFFKRRRRGWKYFKHELREINYFRKTGFISPLGWLIHFVVKAVVRLSPAWLVRIWYSLLRLK